jgi:hypothetical protein
MEAVVRTPISVLPTEELLFMLEGSSRSADAHSWLDEYSAPLLAFFASRWR